MPIGANTVANRAASPRAARESNRAHRSNRPIDPASGVGPARSSQRPGAAASASSTRRSMAAASPANASASAPSMCTRVRAS